MAVIELELDEIFSTYRESTPKERYLNSTPELHLDVVLEINQLHPELTELSENFLIIRKCMEI